MKIALTIAYFAFVIWGAYRIGDKHALAGVVFFIVMALGYSVVINGPQSLFSSGCTRYSSYADNC